ncbi:MAG: hypothetical protein ACOCW0_03770, partial [Halanaerobium sp.]
MYFNKKYLSLIAIISFIFLIIFSYTPSTKALGVEPLIVDLEMSPGETRELQLNLLPSESEETAQLNLYSFTQQETGGLA